jgi:hypothetical protein
MRTGTMGVIPNPKNNATEQIPPTLLKKGETEVKVPLFKGDLGGSPIVAIRD